MTGKQPNPLLWHPGTPPLPPPGTQWLYWWRRAGARDQVQLGLLCYKEAALYFEDLLSPFHSDWVSKMGGEWAGPVAPPAADAVAEARKPTDVLAGTEAPDASGPTDARWST